MLEDFDRQDVEELYRLVKERYSASRPEGYDLMLWGDLHTLFEPDEEDELWKSQHEYNVISWSLYDFCGIHILLMQNGIAIHMLTEKKYPLSQEMISKMLKKKLEDDQRVYRHLTLRFIRSHCHIRRKGVKESSAKEKLNILIQKKLDDLKDNHKFRGGLFYPESYDGEEEMLDEGENWGIDPLEFISNINTSFKYQKKVDGRTQKVIFDAWMNGNWNKRYVDNSISSSNELKESKYENPPNTATDSFFKAYEACDIEKLSQTKRKHSNTSNSIKELPNKRRCKTEKFKSIQYSLGPNEEYIAVRSYEYDIWERNENNMSKIYQDIFQKKDEGWKVTRTK
ncbi:hypothetical protein Tco_0761295 [Tanacetum coccineum]